MTPSDMITAVADNEGWTDITVLGVILDYLDNYADPEHFRNYLSERSNVEIEAS